MTAKIIDKRVCFGELPILEGERGVDKIVFSFPPAYGEIAFSGMGFYANISRSDGTTDKITLTSTQNDDGFLVEWIISASVTAVAGEVVCHISAENGDGTVVFITEAFRLEVKQAVNAYEDFTDREPNALYQLRTQMAAYVVRMQELVDEYENMSGGASGGAVYDEQNKLPAGFVSGLAAVATSGSYNDLTDKPQPLDTSEYCTINDLYSIASAFAASLSPLYIKYVSINADSAAILSIVNENAGVMAEYFQSSPFARPLTLWDVEGNTYYPILRMTDNGTQVNIYFNRNNSAYTAIYNKQTGVYGFSE